MPSEHLSPLPTSQQLPTTQQAKQCSSCHCLLSTDAIGSPAWSAHHELDTSDCTVVCRVCRERTALRTPRQPLTHERLLYVDVQDGRLRYAPTQPTSQALSLPIRASTTPLDHTHAVEEDSLVYSPLCSTPSSSSTLYERPSALFSPAESSRSHDFFPLKPTRPSVDCTTLPPIASDIFSETPSSARFSPSAVKTPSSEFGPSPSLDPFADITRLRVRSPSHQCLYPGAIFQGTQKSGRHSYDVTVSIVDVDFASSFLCGYLCIKGLTDDWPELTTYFDAEIIGTRYGFLTQNWGATEQEDMTHWARFPAFRQVKNKLKMPHGNYSGDGGAVFMRWKERFLVPDHRVQDINGASFAGFYYVCVDFNNSHQPTPAAGKSKQEAGLDLGDNHSPPLPKAEPQRRATTGDISMRSDSASKRSSSVGASKAGPTTAMMSGFYFHQNSEPYQQLSLQHVSDTVSTSYELR